MTPYEQGFMDKMAQVGLLQKALIRTDTAIGVAKRAVKRLLGRKYPVRVSEQEFELTPEQVAAWREGRVTNEDVMTSMRTGSSIKKGPVKEWTEMRKYSPRY